MSGASWKSWSKEKMLDIKKEYLKIVKDILAKHVPGMEVRAFGSRISGRAKKYSDLDLAIIKASEGPLGDKEEPLSLLQLGNIRDAFSESDLPFRVDVVDWAAISKKFQTLIQKKYETIQFPGTQGSP